MNSTYPHTSISTYSEARQAAFRRLVLTRRLDSLQREIGLLEGKISTLRRFGLEHEADLLLEDLVKAQQLIRRIAHGLEAGDDLVATLAPRMLTWAA